MSACDRKANEMSESVLVHVAELLFGKALFNRSVIRQLQQLTS